MPLQVFIGASSKDYELAQQVYDFLTSHNIEVFFSKESLPRLGSSDYRRRIDEALDQAMHMVVVTSSADNARSRWLEAEWGMFVNEIRSGRKEGNLVTLLAGTMTLDKLPLSLRNYEAIPWTQLERVLHYVGGSGSGVKRRRPVAPKGKSKDRFHSKLGAHRATSRRRFTSLAFHLPNKRMLGFAEIPAGPFLMGSDKTEDEKARVDELPRHAVTLPTFYLSRYPVTVAQFRAFAKATRVTPPKASGPKDHPIVNVSWNEAMTYCRWLEDQLREVDAVPKKVKSLLEDGYHFCLPSEAEWEKAARGTRGRVYPWGNRFVPLKANFDDSAIRTTISVTAKLSGASPFGILNMSGNVEEWTRSIYKPYAYVSGDGRERLADGGLRVARGGSFSDSAVFLRAASRFGKSPGTRGDNLGFRVALSRLRS